MQSGKIPNNEQERLAELLQCEILDTETEDVFDELTAMAAGICEVPISLVSLIDSKRQWFKSHHGLGATETPRELAFCGHAILGDEAFIINDSSKDERFADNPLVTQPPYVRFYAGIPLTMSSGYCLGTLCVIDHIPREISSQQIFNLNIVAKQVISQLELRRAMKILERKNSELEGFSYVLSHDLKSPARNIKNLATWGEEALTNGDSEAAQDYLKRTIGTSEYMSKLVDDILEYSRLGVDKVKTETVDTNKLTRNILEHIASDKKVELIIEKPLPSIHTQPIILQQVFTNILSNAIKYCDKNQCIITLTYTELANQIEFSISDNGCGISPNQIDKIFDLFYVANETKTIESTGVGLALAKKLVESIGGKIYCTSKISEGTIFTFTWPI